MSFIVREYEFAGELPPIAIHEDPTGECHILELGAGLGLVGISLAKLVPAAQIVLTDKSDRLRLLQHNVQANQSTATVASYDWEHTDPNIDQQPWDIVLVSDCIWEASLHALLLQALERVMKPETVLLMAFEVRNEAVEKDFLDKLQSTFKCHDIPPEEMDEEYQSDDIRIIRAHRKQ
ncbi:hypothetical protein Unana1_06758 [Umbelopsis nana]